MKKICIVFFMYLALIFIFIYFAIYIVQNRKNIDLNYYSSNSVDSKEIYDINYYAELIYDLMTDKESWETKKLSNNFKTKFKNKTILYDDETEMEVGYSFNYENRLDGNDVIDFYTCYKDDYVFYDEFDEPFITPIRTFHTLTYKYNEVFELDDVILLEKYDYNIAADIRYDVKTRVTTYDEIIFSIHAWLINYNEDILFDIPRYDKVLIGIDDNTRIINKPYIPKLNTAYDSEGASIDIEWNEDRSSIIMTLFNYPNNKKYKINYKYNDDNIFTYIEFTEIPYDIMQMN